MQATNCLNCEHPVTQHQRFCAGCGQRTAVHRLSMHDVGHDAIHYFTHADKGIFSLIWQLLKKPGLVAREYVAGKRKKYFPPLNFFLIVAAICLFITSWLYALKADPMSQAANAIPQNISEDVLQKIERGRNVTHFFSNYTNLVSMGAVPLMSLIVFLFYYKNRHNYTEHLVANMYIVGFTVLVYSLIFMPLSALIQGRYLLYIFFLFELTYRIVSYYYFINQRNGKGIAKAIASNLLASVLWISLSATFIRLYISHGFWGWFS